MVDKVLFSSESTEWGTPQWLYGYLDTIYKFTLDPCATKENAKCETFYTKENDGLLQDWCGHTVFMNPPYGRGITGKWVEKARLEGILKGTIVVCLLPSRTDTLWWHKSVMYHAKKIIFIKGRLQFEGAKNSAPFPSVIVVFDFSSLMINAPKIKTLERRVKC